MMTTTEDRIWPSWDGGGSDCDTCGYNQDEAEFYIDDDGEFYGRVSIGCYSGASVQSYEWADIETWLSDWSHLPGWSNFAIQVRAEHV